MSSGWDERTEAIPGKLLKSSLELDLERPLEGLEHKQDQAPLGFLDQPAILVFEPTPVGVGNALIGQGYQVKVASSAVEVMSAAARALPAVVLCAPAAEPERRRMLAAALKLRFPSVPILYVSTHAKREDAVLGAIREGARAVIAWPFPPPADVKRVLAPYLGAAPPKEPSAPTPRLTVDDFDTAPVRRRPDEGHVTDSGEAATAPRAPFVPAVPGSDPGAGFEELETAVLPGGSVLPSPHRPGTDRTPVQNLPLDAMRPLPPSVHLLSSREGTASNDDVLGDPTTEQRMARPGGPRGEIADLLVAVSPFLWSLEDAALWAHRLGQEGNAEAQSHARTLKMLIRIMNQVRERADKGGV